MEDLGIEDSSHIIRDCVDGSISLKPYAMAVVDTPPFQRLRGLSQLGATHFVFPGATHTRFEHSLGVAYKAAKMARHILKRQGGAAAAAGEGVDMEPHHVMLVTLAGLCHDLGHGPLSHPFENFLKRRGITDWHHEDMSGEILTQIADNYDVGLSRADVRGITDLIRGVPGHLQPAALTGDGGVAGLWRPGQRFLFDIVANKRNGVDVDKLDYLKRDAFMCGVRVGGDFDSLLKKKYTKVLDDELCYDWCQYDNVLDIFRAREAMHRKVYTNRKCKAVEMMAVDALVAAEPLLRITQRLRSAEDFISLDDTLLTTIEHYHQFHRGELEDDEEAALKAAQDIVRRLRLRQLYRFGNQFTVPPEYLADSRWESIRSRFTPAELASHYSGNDVPGGLTPADIVCDENKIDHTMGGENPVERVGFFKEGGGAKFHTSRHQVVGIMPHFFQERVLRVFTPRQEPAYVRAIEAALQHWTTAHFGGGAQLATPVRPRSRSAGGAGAGAAADGPAAFPGGPPGLFPREAMLHQVQASMRPQAHRPSAPAAAAGAAAAAAAAAAVAGACANGALGTGGHGSAGAGGGVGECGVGGGGGGAGAADATPTRGRVAGAATWAWAREEEGGVAAVGDCAEGADGRGGPGQGQAGKAGSDDAGGQEGSARTKRQRMGDGA
ncbi:hypothetical protein HXX76_002480 [Chlamydomonas incerta]|uniref:HD domain-containing protein n=1 Tax=Chlamydomonas incerta TaxID=51695 RepID=A0A835W930_CHLIN|nr:hypothetical protein HXX76_002480 [Chlamydomonas incerta]|eukprot:KAG2442394.1 hypothetical protein HXX76_002480 [Chlamydomonas incerta]